MVGQGNFDEKRWKLGICLVVGEIILTSISTLCRLSLSDDHYINMEYFAEKWNPSIRL